MLARLLGVPHHEFADLFGDLRTAADNKLVVDPGDNDDITVPAIAKSCLQILVDTDEPTFANDCFRGRDDTV
jgi:hypothetical protein